MTETPNDDRMPPLGAEIDALLADPELWMEPSAGLEDRIVLAIESEAAPLDAGSTPARRAGAWRGAFLGAVAVLILLLGAVVMFSAIDGGPDEEMALDADLVPTGLVNDVSGTVEVSDTESGVRLSLDVEGLPRRADGSYYEGWVRTDTDDLVSVGTFREGASVVLWAGMPLAEIVAFSITQEGVAALDDSGAESSGEVVLKADLPREP